MSMRIRIPRGSTRCGASILLRHRRVLPEDLLAPHARRLAQVLIELNQYADGI